MSKCIFRSLIISCYLFKATSQIVSGVNGPYKTEAHLLPHTKDCLTDS